MENIHILVTVIVSENDSFWGASKNGEAEVRITVPRVVIENLNVGNIFESALQAALLEYDSKTEES